MEEFLCGVGPEARSMSLNPRSTVAYLRFRTETKRPARPDPIVLVSCLGAICEEKILRRGAP